MPLPTGHAGPRAQYARLCPDCAPGYGDRGSFAPYARTNSPVGTTINGVPDDIKISLYRYYFPAVKIHRRNCRMAWLLRSVFILTQFTPCCQMGQKTILKNHQFQGGFEIACQTSQNYLKLFHNPLNDGIYISPELKKTAIPKNREKISHRSSCQTLALGVRMKLTEANGSVCNFST